jgi:DNA-binding NarL/FixJ family response regulator
MASILIIQSRDVLRALFRELFERAGHVVHDSSEGLQGIRQYRESPTDLVITDIQFADCEGLEVIVALGQEYPAVKIVAVSGTVEEDSLMASKRYGVDAIVPDPLDCESLLKTVENLLGGT